MKKIMLLTFAIIFAVIAVQVYAQVIGCCCDPSSGTGSFDTQTGCLAKNFVFAGPPHNVSVTCNMMCNATVTPPPPTPINVSCGSATYRPPPANAVAAPVKGSKSIRLDFTLPCPTNYIKIFRCKGAGCTNFQQIASISPATTYTDSDPNLLWDENYNYRIMANYPAAGDSFNASVSANTGDIECWNQKDTSVFCLSRFYYSQSFMKDYLENNGYKGNDFADFDNDVRDTFNSFFENAYRCNNINKLSAPVVSCPTGKMCVADGTTARCIEPSPCAVEDKFGFFTTKTACEGSTTSKNYCFYDKSKSNIDKCYDCDPQMKCYDYHSQGACISDNCGIGQCAWQDVFPSLGIGVCHDTRFDLCSVCGNKYTTDAENQEAYNLVFDACSEAKASTLSTAQTPCFFNKNTKSGESCDTAKCTSYTAAQCSSPSGGIRLASDNSISTGSNDPCGIGVCQSYTSEGITYCVKNADGSSGYNWQDCVGFADPEACERDYFPPSTQPYISGLKPGKHDFINIIIKDKLSRAATPIEMQGEPGYMTYMCIVSNNTYCNAASQFTINTTSTQLNINDLNLQDGQNIVGRLQFGQNMIKYFSVDEYKNIEVFNQAIVVFACDQCSGPKMTDFLITNGREVNNVYYTNSINPSITVMFNEPAQITTASLTKGPATIPVTVSPGSGSSYQFTFTPSSPLLQGDYQFSLNSVDNNAVYMDDPLAVNIVVDTTPPTVSITPEDQTEFSSNTAAVTLNFSEPVILGESTLDEIVFVDELVKKPFPILLSEKLNTDDDAYFFGSISNLREGLKIVNVDVVDYASNLLKTTSTFSVITTAPKTRIKDPSWGVASSNLFDVVFETSSTAECRYIYDVPVPPPVEQYDSMAKFDNTGTAIEHKISNFNKIPFGDKSKHAIHVYCKTENFGTTITSFELSVDPSSPSIITSFAKPNPIIEAFKPNMSLYTTRLMIQTNKDSFCRYSATAQNFTAMEGRFPGYDETPKESHSVEVNVTQAAQHKFYVGCKSLSELTSPVVFIDFYVDLSIPFKVNNTTPRYSKDALFFLRVDTNKRSFCYFGENPQEITNCFGDCSFTLGHAQQVTKPPGTHNFYVKCNTGAGGEISNTTEVTVTVDTSGPRMLYVDDSSTLPGDPDISWYSNKLRVSFLGNDTETDIVKYYYLLETAFAREMIINWTPSLELNGSPIYVKANLTDGTRYVFRVKPVNIVGLEGNYTSSNGVMIDTTKAPPECANGELDAVETDIDCGGSCSGCGVGKICIEDGDCESLFCLNNTCAPAACDDIYKNGKETDVDCGGADCDPCEIGKICAEDTDCDSEKCKYGECVIPDPCENGILDGTESAVDCGGSCPLRCGDGQNCNLAEDCDTGLSCVDGACGMPRDLDSDGVMDDIDDCPDTPAGEFVDEYGCSLSQVYSCNDEMDDAWRTRYFGDVLCDGDGSPLADSDNDGLTNIEEYRIRTDPSEKDTDGDGWSDGKELNKDTDPKNPDDHPTSIIWTLFWIILILAVLAGAGFGIYYGYKKGYFEQLKEKFKKKPKEEEKPPEEKLKPKPTLVRKKPSMAKIDPLRRLVKKKETEAPDDFVSLGALKRPVKEKPKPSPQFARLKSIRKSPKKPRADSLARLKKLKTKKKAARSKEDSIAALKRLKERKPAAPKTDALAKLKKLKKKKGKK